MPTTTNIRTHYVARPEEKSPTSKRFAASGLITEVRDAGFAGVEYEITDVVEMVIEAETFDRAYEIASSAMDLIQTQTGVDDRKHNYVELEQID